MTKMIHRSNDSSGTDTSDPPFSVGAFLQRHRKLRGLSIDEIGTLTKIPVRSIERLESGLYDRMNDGFGRGFVRTVAEAIGLDSEEIIARMMVQANPSVRRRQLRSSAVAILLVCGVGFLLLATFTAALLGSRDASSSGTTENEVIHVRKDPVRLLAEELDELARKLEAKSPVGSARFVPEVRQ